jgi:hypothetical protein
MERKLHFSTEQTLYLILNIIAHDVIHDYGPAGGTEKRWQNNQIIVKQFTNDYYTFTNPLVGGQEQISKKSKIDSGSTTNTTTNSDLESDTTMQITNIPGTKIYTFGDDSISQRRKLKARRPDITSSSQSFPGIPQKIEQQPRLDYARGITNQEDLLTFNYENYTNTVNEMKNDINNTIIFTFFNHFLLFLQTNTSSEINYIDSKNYIVPLGLNDNNYTDLFKDICNKFIGYCYLNNVAVSLSYADYLNILCYFLSSGATKQSIFENIDFLQSVGVKRKTYDGGFRHKIGGKKDPELTYEEATNLLNDIDILNKSEQIQTYLNKLNDIYIEYNRTQGTITQENKKNYEDTRKLLIKEYQNVFLKYGQEKKSGSLYGDVDILPVIKIRYSRHSVNLIENFNDKIKLSLLDFYKIIDEYNKTQEKIERKRLEDLLASQQGELTSMDKEVRQQFSRFIARSGLFLTNICKNTGIIEKKNSVIPSNSALRKEINILLYISEWTQNVGWQEIRNQSLDDELISFFNDNSPEIEGRYRCPPSTPNYVVNNAAPISSDLKNNSFCPYTSILDGMSQCSWNSAQGTIEYGNMDFYITNTEENLYYNGKLNIDNSKTENGYPTNLNILFNVKVNPNLTLNGNKNTTINGIDLEAHFVLKNTLLNIINYILSVDDSKKSLIFTNGKIFDNLFNLFSNNDINLFNLVYSEILFKGTGDLFQEINCVSKFGGYTMNNYKIDKGILSYKTSNGEQLRFFAANDRPSGTRFIYMLLNGNSSEINSKAMGGYYSKENILVVKRPENKNNCQPIPSVTGGKKNKTKTKKIRNHKNTKIKKYRTTKKRR